MDEEILIQCDVCREQFGTESLSLDVINIDGLAVQYFSCPYCGRRYPVVLEDREQHKLHLQISSAQADIQVLRSRGKDIPQARLRKLNRLFDEAKKHQDLLREEYIDAVTAQLNSGS